MNNTLYKRVAPICIIALIGVAVLGAITAWGSEKTGIVAKENYIRILKSPPPARLAPEEQAVRQAAYTARAKALLDSAMGDERVQQVIDSKQYNVVGVARKPPPMGTIGEPANVPGSELLALRVEGKYYIIAIDLNSKHVTSIETRGLF